MTIKARTIILCMMVALPALSLAQGPLNAMVADSASLKPVPFATIRIVGSYRGTITNEQGYFAMDVSENDTLLFSTVGYYSKKVAVSEIRKASVVYLTQFVQVLKEIEFTGRINITSMLPKLDAPSVYRNHTTESLVPDATKGFQGFQTFGPGYVSSFGELKPSKEEKKLQRVKKENQKAKGYVALVNDPEVKDKVMKEYNLTESNYYDHLATFNQKNKDFIYDLDDSEVVHLIFLYFKDNVK